MVSKNILLLDRELLSREMLTSHLKQNGFKVLAAESCAEARKLIPKNRFRLAIINFRLGEKETGEIISQLYKCEEDVLIYLLLPQPAVFDAGYLSRRRIYDTIVKPFRLDEVRIKLNHGLELLNLRQAVRKLTERLYKLEKKLKKYETVEEEVKIPDLSELDLDTEDFSKGTLDLPDNKSNSGAANQDPVNKVFQGKKSAEECDAIEQIRRLDNLRLAGIITETEFNSKKKELLKRI